VRSAVAYLDTLQGSGIRPGLGRVRALLRTLGRPERAYPSIIVAGTNGKGSTSATLTSILNASGYRTGFYTSPHLVDLRERWTIGGEMIDESLFIETVEAMRRGAEKIGISPTYFEALTVIAFLAFREAACDVAVIEVGMGGRLDATNVVRPLASLITPIGIDHTEFLGNTIRRIAREKAGVIHRGSIALTSNRDAVILSVLKKRAQKFGSELHVVPDEVTIEPPLRLTTPHDRYELTTPLAGEFQRDNVALAVRAAEELRPQLSRVSHESIVRGVAATQWRGRLEHVVLSGKDIWIDGFHNAHAVAAIRTFIETMPRPRLLVFGIMSDKDVREVARLLLPMFDSVITTEPYAPRCTSAAVLAEIARSLGVTAIAEPDPKRAIARALRSKERSILIGGSLYLAGAAIEAIDQQKQ